MGSPVGFSQRVAALCLVPRRANPSRTLRPVAIRLVLVKLLAVTHPARPLDGCPSVCRGGYTSVWSFVCVSVCVGVCLRVWECSAELEGGQGHRPSPLQLQ